MQVALVAVLGGRAGTAAPGTPEPRPLLGRGPRVGRVARRRRGVGRLSTPPPLPCRSLRPAVHAAGDGGGAGRGDAGGDRGRAGVGDGQRGGRAARGRRRPGSGGPRSPATTWRPWGRSPCSGWCCWSRWPRPAGGAAGWSGSPCSPSAVALVAGRRARRRRRGLGRGGRARRAGAAGGRPGRHRPPGGHPLGRPGRWSWPAGCCWPPPGSRRSGAAPAGRPSATPSGPRPTAPSQPPARTSRHGKATDQDLYRRSNLAAARPRTCPGDASVGPTAKGDWLTPEHPSKGTVLLVEDEASIADLVRLYLERDGFRVVWRTDGPSGLAAVDAERPRLVLLDLMLPGMDGFEVTRALRQRGGRVPIIVVTAREEEADRVLGLELGADDYVTKPFSPRELVARVKAVLRRDRARTRGRSRAAAPPGQPHRRPGPPRGRLRGPPGAAHRPRVRAAQLPGPQPGPGPHPRPDPGTGLGLLVPGRHPHRRRPHPPAPLQAGRPRPHPHHPRRRLQGRRPRQPGGAPDPTAAGGG